MAENDNTATYLAIMELQEALQAGIEASEQIRKTPFENVSRATWQAVQDHQKHYEMLAKMMLDQLPDATKIIENPAVRAHISAVTSGS